MKNGEFEVGTVIKGKDLKKYILCKILSDDLVMQGFQYRIGMNEDVNQLAVKGDCKTGLHFCLIKDICNYLYYGTKLAIISIPDEEDVCVDHHDQLRVHRMEIRKIMLLSKETTWMYLHENGADITAWNNYAVKYAAENGYLESVEYLHKNGADITAQNNYAVKLAAENGHLKVVKYLHRNGADITAEDNYALRRATENDHMDVVEYLRTNM